MKNSFQLRSGIRHPAPGRGLDSLRKLESAGGHKSRTRTGLNMNNRSGRMKGLAWRLKLKCLKPTESGRRP